ncbi:MAG: hypothetical protein M0Z82_12940, partial [Actinomycetota bacterium]|nr:hypothetical protein [Actinomycetota bacterium]
RWCAGHGGALATVVRWPRWCAGHGGALATVVRWPRWCAGHGGALATVVEVVGARGTAYRFDLRHHLRGHRLQRLVECRHHAHSRRRVDPEQVHRTLHDRHGLPLAHHESGGAGDASEHRR